MSLTPRQRDLMLFVQRYMDINGGVSPSFDEMQAGLGLGSKSGIKRLIDGLIERGYLTQIKHRARSIDVVKRAPDPDQARSPFASFVENIARMTPGGRDADDDAATINSLRRRAVELMEGNP